MRSRSIRRSACSTLPKSGWSRVKRPAPVREYAAGAASACGGLYPGLSSRLLTMADLPAVAALRAAVRSEEHTSELQSLMRISYAVFCLKKKKNKLKTYQRDQIK